MKIDSFIFDLDGTMWDSTSSAADSWNRAMERYGEEKRITVEDMKGVMGLVVTDIAKKFLPDTDDAKRLDIIKETSRFEHEYLEKHGAILYDKLEETLEELSKEHKLFIVSNCQCGYIEAFLNAHKLHKYFTDFENSGRTGMVKGENIKLVIERNHLNSPVYVGDTDGDLKGARLAGIPFVYARYGFGHVNEYDYVIDSFDELLKLI